jgi:hypothetical protein
MKHSAVAGLWWDAWQTAIAAQTTIALRLWSLATPGERDSAWGQAEMVRMVAEKQAAFMEAGFAMQRAMLRSASTATIPVLTAGLRPYRTKTQANAKRLTRRL